MLSCALMMSLRDADEATIAEQMWPAQEAMAGQNGCDAFVSAARVRGAIHFEQSLAVDAGIDLRGRERGMAEQLLDRAQIAAARQQMRGKGMPERMRGRTVGQSQR